MLCMLRSTIVVRHRGAVVHSHRLLRCGMPPVLRPVATGGAGPLMGHGPRGRQRCIRCMHARVPWSNEAIGVLAGRHRPQGDVGVRVPGIRGVRRGEGGLEGQGWRGVCCRSRGRGGSDSLLRRNDVCRHVWRVHGVLGVRGRGATRASLRSFSLLHPNRINIVRIQGCRGVAAGWTVLR